MMEDPLAAMVRKVSLDPNARITTADVVAWGGSLLNWDFYNAISLRIAENYHAGALSYAVCDHIMNDLWGTMYGNLDGQRVPSPFYDIYEAFDAGEYYRTSDRSDDPVATHTNPMIRDVLLEYSPANDNSATASSQNEVDR